MSNDSLTFVAFVLAFILLFLVVFYHNRKDDKNYVNLMTNKENNDEEECVTF
jgi:hypothetical protein